MSEQRYPPIADYGLISDCYSAALVSRHGSIDWCCMPRFDCGSYFGRLIDWKRGGFYAIAPADDQGSSFQDYLPDTLVLVTTFQTSGGEARLIDCFTVEGSEEAATHRHLLRVVEGVRGHCEFRIQIAPRFDYGEVRPWLRMHGIGVYSAIGGDDGLIITGDPELEEVEDHELHAVCTVRGGERVRLSLRSARPDEIDRFELEPADPAELDRALERTANWWRKWAARGRLESPEGPGALRSGIVLKALTYKPTGAIVGAPTTSLPEDPGGSRNWDYRFSWVRDSTFCVRSLAELGHEEEADDFRRFIERAAAGHADELQIAYGVGGECRLTEQTLDGVEGYRGSQPVRIGNSAARQIQLDAYGEIVNLSWRWHKRGHSPDDDHWRFLVDLVETAVSHWKEPDNGIWEWPGEPQHFVHSKVMCWVAVDRGLRLAEECMRRAPTRRWEKARDEMRRAIEKEGYDARRGVFVQTFGCSDLDASLLLLPTVGFIGWDDERMLRTARAIKEELDDDGLVRRYKRDDGLEGEEGAFVACTFWLAECLIEQGRIEEGREVFDRALSAANHLGLFSEQFGTRSGELLGNFPQAISHYSHIAAALSLGERREPGSKDAGLEAKTTETR